MNAVTSSPVPASPPGAPAAGTSAPATRRRPSRGRAAPRSSRSDGEATRARILQAAGELFAAHGLSGTTSKAVAAHAGVDMALINYHFKSRDGLYQAVLEEAHRQLISLDTLATMAAAPLPASEKIRLLLAGLVAQALDPDPHWYMPVLAGALVTPSEHTRELLLRVAGPKLQIAREILAQELGCAPDHPATVRCLISTGGPCILMLIGGRNLPGPLQELRQMPADDLTDHLHRFAMAGIEAIRATLSPAAPQT